MKEPKARRSRWDPVFPSTATTGSNFPLGYTLWKWKGAGRFSPRSGQQLWDKELGKAVDSTYNIRQSWELCHPSLLEQLAQAKQTVSTTVWRYACDWPRWNNHSKTVSVGLVVFCSWGILSLRDFILTLPGIALTEGIYSELNTLPGIGTQNTCKCTIYGCVLRVNISYPVIQPSCF